jgi:BirA family transcriptional regulator, biotin operon repressor / biotin---[acetyl-CoA-carboxylase] ligase
VGVAIADALDPPAATPPRIGLKWPNDLWLLDGSEGVGRKLGGILIETISVGAARMCVVGVGLNVSPQAVAPEALAGLTHGCACLQELDPTASAPAALQRVAPALVHALKRFEAGGFAPLVSAYARRDLLQGRSVVVSGNEPLRGTAGGVDGNGALLLHAEGGAPAERIVSGEVSVRLAQG